MRPALQRVHGRPTSLDLFRYISGQPLHDHQFGHQLIKRSTLVRTITRKSSAVAFTESREHGLNHGGQAAPSTTPHTKATIEAPTDAQLECSTKLLDVDRPTNYPNISLTTRVHGKRAWNEDLFTAEQLEFESGLGEQLPTNTRRLVDHPNLKDHTSLWLCLLQFQQRRYGVNGVKTIWEAMTRRKPQIAVGLEADKLWRAFINMGLEDRSALLMVAEYSDRMLTITGKKWPKLYTAILQHFVMGGEKKDVAWWHERLIELHPPSSSHFSRLMSNAIHNNGDADTIECLYELNGFRTLYTTIVPALLDRGDFQSALRWHFFLLRHKDLPPSAKVVEPLLHHFAVYDRRTARRITQSLVASGVKFDYAVDEHLRDNTKISREMMNLLHGETIKVGPKAYNDRLGARWFATKWISLDVSIGAVHALGVTTIGPLSLQAIAMRELEAPNIQARLRQLTDCGIAVVDCAYSKALMSFARSRDMENLHMLLDSDLHPDSYEDWDLQETLMSSFAKSGDWAKYQMLLAVRTASTGDSQKEYLNISLRQCALQGEISQLLHTLFIMRNKGIAVTSKTIQVIVQSTLRPRSRGRHPMSHFQQDVDDLNLVISILLKITTSNCFVPLFTWREIIRRLGKLGRLDDLHRLCLWLAQWYKPNSDLRQKTYDLTMPTFSDKFMVPSQVPTSHPLHPLRVLFPDSLQKAMIEWGFIHTTGAMQSTLKDQPVRSLSRQDTSNHGAHYTWGIRLLHELHKQGVAINTIQVRRAIYHRLEVLYGPGRSSKARNHILRDNNTETLQMAVDNINQAFGATLFGDVQALRMEMNMKTRRRLARASNLRERPQLGHVR